MNGQEPQEKPNYAIPPDAHLIIKSPSEIEAEQRSEQRRNEQEHNELIRNATIAQTRAQVTQARSNVLVARLTGAIVVLSIVSAFISYLQFIAAKESAIAAAAAAETARRALDESNDSFSKTLAEMKAQSQTSRDSLELARDNFRKDQRPYVWVGKDLGQPQYFARSQQITWTFHITNFGKTPANNVRIRKLLIVRGQRFETHGVSPKRINHGIPLPPTADQFDTVISRPGISADEFDRLMKAEGALGIVVKVSYTDGGGASHETAFCYVHLANGALNYCTEDNYIK